MLPYVPNFKPSGRRATGGRRLVLTGRTSHHLHPGQRSSQPWWLEPTDSQKPHISLHSRNLRENSSLLQVASYLTTSQWRVGDAVWHRDKPFGSQGLVFDEFWNLRAGVSRESSRWNPGLWQTNRYNCGVLFAVGNLVSHLAFTQTCPFGVYPNIFWESDNVSITQPQVTSSPHGFLFTGSQAGPLGQLEAILMMLESSKSMQRSTSCNLKNGCSLLKNPPTFSQVQIWLFTGHVEICFIQYLSFQTTSFCAIPYLECQIPPKIHANQVSSTSSTPAMPWSSISTSNS